ncbi:hypothetical protein [Kitasatospora sp. NPDC004289]
MGTVPGWLLRHQITIEPYLGDAAYGPVYGPPVTVRCLLEEKTREVRSSTGEQVISSSTAYCPPGTTGPPSSRVTLPDGRLTSVIAKLDRSAPGLPTPDHVELQLT